MLIHMADHRGEGLDQVGSSPAPSSPRKMITVGDQIPRRGAGAHQLCPSPLVPAAQRSPCFPPPAFRQARNYGHLILHFRDGATRISGLAYRERTRAANPRFGGRLAGAAVARALPPSTRQLVSRRSGGRQANRGRDIGAPARFTSGPQRVSTAALHLQRAGPGQRQ
jgi:hypothetical protein